MMLFTMSDVTAERWRFICIYFKCFQIHLINYRSVNSLPPIETLFIETVMENYKLLIISIYRHPCANAIFTIDKLSERRSIISGNGYDEIVLSEDFNLDILNNDKEKH